MSEALRLFDQLGIKFIPTNQARRRTAFETSCNKFVNRLIASRGLPHVTIVLRAITESSEANAHQLISDIIGAISDIALAHPRWPSTGLAWLESFDSISLADVRKAAKKTAVQPLRLAVATILCLRLEEILGPSILPKPPKPAKIKPPPKLPLAVTRIPEIEKNIALGVELLALREATASNTRFGRLLRAQFKVDQMHASRAMRAARCFANKPEIYRRLSWITLVELSSPKMSEAVRRTLEARVLAGEKISAVHIRRARGRLKGGSPKRRNPDQPARMAA